MKKLILLLFLIFPLILNAQFWSSETGWTIIYSDTLGIGQKNNAEVPNGGTGNWTSDTDGDNVMLLTDTTKTIEFDGSEGVCTLAAIAYDVQGDGGSNGDLVLGFQIKAPYEPGNGTITDYWLPSSVATTGDSTYIGLLQTERIVDGGGCYFDLGAVTDWVLADEKRLTIVSLDTVHLILMIKYQ